MRGDEECFRRTRGGRVPGASGGVLAGIILCMAVAQGAPAPGDVPAATGQHADSPPPVSSVELEEVEVIGKKLYQMQRELVRAQDRFYSLYNELNTLDDFDIHCTVYARTGTRIQQRDCRIEFLQEATAQAGQNFFLGLTSDPPTPPRAGISAQMLWFQRRDEYRQAVRSLLESNPELQQLALKWQQLQEQYDRARKARHRDRLVLFE